jgi:uncharacterized protein YjbI with pentapeptide repeats
MKIISRFDGRTLYEDDASTMLASLLAAIKAKANLRGSNLRGSNLRGSNLSYSNLSYSNLRGSNLRGSNLSYSNLSYSNLSGSDLSGSDLSGSDLSGSNLRGSDLRGKPILNIVQVSGIGSERRTTVAIITARTCEITCGCFRGTLDEWRTRIEATHAAAPTFLAQYRAAVAFVEACAAAARS